MGNRIKKTIRDIIRREITDVIEANNLAIRYNYELREYRGLYTGKDIYIVGCGPTVKYFTPKDDNNSVFIGVNRAFKDTRFVFDYLFAQDQMEEGMQDFLSYRESKCRKLVAIIPHEDATFRVADYSSQMKDTIRYVLSGRRMCKVPFDISVEPIADLCGTVFSAVQFALFTNPDHIYLVGFDCSEGNTYNKSSNSYNYQLEGWHKIKDHIQLLKKDNLLISVNPIGLKGLFNEVYTLGFANEMNADINDCQLYDN